MFFLRDNVTRYLDLQLTVYLKRVLGVGGVVVYDAHMSPSIQDDQLVLVLQAEGRKSRIHPEDPF